MLREFYDDFPVYETVRDMILDGAKRGNDKRQFIWEDRKGNQYEKTFREVYEDECKIGAYMRSLGIVKGMKVAILSENCYMWNAVYYAIAVNGSVVVPMDARLTGEEIAGEFLDCECDAVFYSRDNADKIETVKNTEGMTIKWYFPMDEMDEMLEKGSKADRKYLDEYLNTVVTPDDLVCIVYTSGTTGKTKGVMLSNSNIASDVVASLHAITGKNGIGFLPLNHTYAWVTGLFASLIRSEWGYICTNIRHVYNDIKKYKPYQFAAVPMVVEMIYHNIIATAKRNGSYDELMSGIEMSRNFMLSGYDARREIFHEIHESLGGNLNYILCGGAHLNPEIEEFMHDIGIQIITGYGLTECSPCITCSRRYNYRLGSVGLVLDCNEVKINDPDEEGVGEIYVKGKNVMLGYYNDEQATKSVFDGEWFKTGDLGYIDKEGYLFFKGRIKNLIILSNGKNVSPEEIEDKLYELEYVKEVLVYDSNEKIFAEFYLDRDKYPDCEAQLEEDVAKINSGLAEFKRIQKILTRDTEFPKTTTLKIIRKYNK